MSDGGSSEEAEEALRVAKYAMELGEKQAAQIYAAKKMGYETYNHINAHEQVCSLRAQQTLDQVGELNKKLDKLASALLGTITALALIIGGIGWIVQTSTPA